ncbi:MAG: ABC transporter permease [Actinobacteria bacterium]|nr:ABC transporter permease [Actinomycetota bacterium]
MGVPAFLAAVCALLYLYVSRIELDSIEQRSLNVGRLSEAILEHVELTVVSTVLVILIAVPVGILLTRGFARRITPPIIAVFNIGQAVPSIGVLALLAVLFLFTGYRAAIVGLVAYAALPVLRNTMVGLQQVDRSVLESGRGMGMTKLGVLTRLELPLAVPVILAGIRTALVINVGTATLATFINGGGLGDIINAGLTTNRFPVQITGAVLTAVLALFIDYLGGIVEDLLHPRGL